MNFVLNLYCAYHRQAESVCIMRQYQYLYKDEEDFIKKLAYFKKESYSLHASKVLIHILSTNTDEVLLQHLCEQMDTEFPEALYIGCTTNANIHEGRFRESAITFTFSIYTDPDTNIVLVQENLEQYSLDGLIQKLLTTQERHPEVKAVEMLVSAYGMLESNFTSFCEKYKMGNFVLFGGGAYTGESDADSCVFAKGWKPDSKALALAFYSGRNFHIDTRHVSGWKPLGHDFKITSAEGNVLKTLNNRPAFDIYSQYLDIENDEYFESNAIEFPFICKTKDGKDIMRTPVSSRPDGSIVMFSEIDTFPRVRLSYGDKGYITKCIDEEACKICSFRPDAITLFSCVARRAFWADDIDRESAIFQQIAPTSGFYTSGEVLSEGKRLYHYNETLLIVSQREGDIDESLPQIDLSLDDSKKNKSLISRFAKFISTASEELEETNRNLDHMVKEVEKSRKQAEAANRAKSDFLANMSHEIRTPINAILGFDTMILRESSENSIINYASDIMNASNNLLTIINDILDLSKIESGKMTVVAVEYELKKLAQDVINMMSMKAGDKGLRLKVDIDRKLPSLLYGDDVRIRQIIVNLMNNAVKYTEEGSVTLKISGQRNGDYEKLHIEVRDTGIGIKPEDMNKLFEKFARIEEKRNHNIEGTGLGMNITINLLSMMNSKLNVESEYGKGSCFSFDIEQKILSDEPVGSINERTSEHRDETSYTSSFTAPDADVLVVDDNPMNREVIVALLKRTKIHFEQADGGLTCLDMTRKKKYDLILLDHMMPDLDGIKTLHRIREEEDNLNHDTPIVCMTANAVVGAMEEYIWEGFDDYISKPIKPDRIEKILAERLPSDIVLMAHDRVASLCADAPSNSEAQEEESEITELPDINGIDNETALSNLASPKLVIKTMRTFVNGAAAEADYILKCLDVLSSPTSTIEDATKAVGDYRIKVHAMKSSALTIGAVMVSNLAKFLEYSSRDNNTDNLRSVTVPFLNEWKALTARVAEAIEPFKISEEPKTDNAQELDTNQIKQMLDKLNTSIGEMDIDSADSIISELKESSFARNNEADFSDLEQAVTNIDIDEVERCTQKLAAELK